jgi:hypothetical protein
MARAWYGGGQRAGQPRHEGALDASGDGVKLFVVDPRTIYRRGLAACLEGLSEVKSLGHAGSVREVAPDGGTPAAARLTEREQQVLSLTADGTRPARWRRSCAIPSAP